MNRLKHLKTHYLCTVHASKRKVYDFKKGKLITRPQWGMAEDKEKAFPVFGFVCPKCEIANSGMNHYLVNKESICEECALKTLEEK